MNVEAAISERRSRTREIIDEVLTERQELLVAFCTVAGLEPYTAQKPVEGLLPGFCQILVDYVSLVHFELYSRIDEGKERRREAIRTAEGMYPRLAETTQAAVDFNDRYETVDHELVVRHLSEDLSALGQTLASRFEVEDQLFSALLSHSPPTP